MKVKVSEASGLVLNWLVAKCEGWFEPLSTLLPGSVAMLDRGRILFRYGPEDDNEFDPVNDWSQGGPIIEREKMDALYMGDGLAEHYWRAEAVGGYTHAEGPTPLVAAMRCYVASKLGDEVEMPDEIGGSDAE